MPQYNLPLRTSLGSNPSTSPNIRLRLRLRLSPPQSLSLSLSLRCTSQSNLQPAYSQPTALHHPGAVPARLSALVLPPTPRGPSYSAVAASWRGG